MFITRYISLLLMAASLTLQTVSAQEINGDTVYTSVALPIILQFPSGVTNCSFSDFVANDRFHTIVIGSSVNVRAKKDNVKPALLLITEGDRHHSFVVVYRKIIALDQTTFGWNTVEDLNKHVAALQIKANDVAANNLEKNDAGKIVATTTGRKIAADSSVTATPLKTMLKSADTTGMAKANDAAKAKKYDAEIIAANKAFKTNNYREATTRYQSALNFAPGDVYATRQLGIVKIKLDSVKEEEKNNALFDALILKANSLVTALDFDNAKEYLNEAHSVRPLDSLPLVMIRHVESAQQSFARRKQYKDSTDRVLQTRNVLAQANQEILARNWDTALVLYKKVLTLQPTPEQEDFSQKKIDALNLQLQRVAQEPKTSPGVTKTANESVVITPEVELKKPDTASDKQTPLQTQNANMVAGSLVNENESKNPSETPKSEEDEKIAQEKFRQRKIKINDWMDKGQQAFLRKDWDSAKACYRQAIGLFPTIEKEKFARKKIEEIDLEIAKEQSTNLSASGSPEVGVEQKSMVKENKPEIEPAKKDVAKLDSTPLAPKQDEQLQLDKQKAQRDSIAEAKKEEDTRRKEQINTLLQDAQKEILAKNRDSAKAIYQKVAELKPTDAQADFLSKKIKTLEVEIAKRSQPKIEVKQTDSSMSLHSAQQALPMVIQPKGIATNVDTAAHVQKHIAQDFPKVSSPQKNVLLSAGNLNRADTAVAEVKKDNLSVRIDDKVQPKPVTKNKDPIAATTPLKGSNENAGNKETDLQRTQIIDLLISAQQAIIAKNLDSARELYKQVLLLHPTADRAEFVKQEIETLDRELTKKGASNIPSIKKTPTSLSPSSTTALKGSPEHHNAAATHYQDSADVKNTDTGISKDILKKTPRINLADSNNSIRLICQDVVFNGKNAYFKMVVKNNNNASSFMADDFKITYIKNYGILKKLRTANVMGSVEVSAHNQLQLVYATEAFDDVEPNEIFIIELQDNLKTSVLTIYLSGEMYNKLKSGS